MRHRWQRFAQREDRSFLSSNGLVPLSALKPGEQGVVAKILCGRNLLCRITSLGFTPGAKVTMVQNYGHGPLIVQVRGARVALGRGEAGKLYVRRGAG